MNSVYRVLLSIHGLLGLVALISYWIAILSPKGSPRHRGIGKTYFIAMLGLVVTALPMAVIIAARGNVVIAGFLLYLVVITATSMYLGWFAIQRRRAKPQYFDRRHAFIAWFNVAAAIGVLTLGWKYSAVLLMGFSVAGFALATQMLVRRMRPLASARWWLQEHYGAMLGCGVATHIAFLAIGLNRLVQAAGLSTPGWFNLIAWFTPLVIANGALLYLNQKYFHRRAVVAGESALASR